MNGFTHRIREWSVAVANLLFIAVVVVLASAVEWIYAKAAPLRLRLRRAQVAAQRRTRLRLAAVPELRSGVARVAHAQRASASRLDARAGSDQVGTASPEMDLASLDRDGIVLFSERVRR